ncbi:TetR/AcrR family transcriptional regulator [Actinophytocola sp.]|jgi:AcrR family transcriptional regulator|uniref:TetR/AcrR family transcriptional regulator n=1 Tax=Actinophytocola sp. TaxID=1872138 RepID=UPI002ED82A9D
MTTAPEPEDLTARARIRDAAMRHFGEHGFERATIRAIAETAGVSSGLVRHHFGSKQALRDACDEYLSRAISRLNDQAHDRRGVGHIAEARIAMGPYQRYLARTLAEGAGASIFDDMVRMAEEWVEAADEDRPDPPHVDRKSRATVATAMGLAVAILYPHVARGLGVDLYTPEGDAKLSRTLLDIYSQPWISPAEAATLRAGLDKFERGEPR